MLMTTPQEKFADWFSTPLGEAVYQAGHDQLLDILPSLFGYYILQYSYSAQSYYLASSRIANKTLLFLNDTEIDENVLGIRAAAEELPLQTNSIDVIVLPHILEYSKDVHKLLREMDRVLIDDGHVVIIGINPFSLFGLWHFCLCWWNRIPWHGRLLFKHRLKDWLLLLGFEVEKIRHCFYTPPFRNPKRRRQFMPLERLGRYCCPILGGLYVIVAKKRVLPLTPIKIQWKIKRQLLNPNIANPTARIPDNCTRQAGQVKKSL